jgi:hypothetical protein
VNVYKERKNALKLLAEDVVEYKSLSDFFKEYYRLDRIISDEYVKSNEVKEYNEFCLDWIKNNYVEVVTTNKWDYDIPVSDDPYELSLNNIINKLESKCLI